MALKECFDSKSTWLCPAGDTALSQSKTAPRRSGLFRFQKANPENMRKRIYGEGKTAK